VSLCTAEIRFIGLKLLLHKDPEVTMPYSGCSGVSLSDNLVPNFGWSEDISYACFH